MKKIIALLIILFLAVPALGIGEIDLAKLDETELRDLISQATDSLRTLIEENYSTYTNGINGYQILYPDDWQPVSKENVDSMAGKYPKIEPYKQQIIDNDVAVFIDKTNGDNISVFYQDVSVAISNEEFISAHVQDALQEARDSLEAQTGVTALEVSDGGSIYTFGDMNYVLIGFTYTKGGKPMNLYQLYYFYGTTMYTLSCTFEENNEDFVSAINTMAESLIPN